MIKLEQAVIVEGKYDKIRLENIIDATIITTEGFRVFKDKEKCRLIRLLAEKRGVIIMTDSDYAGQMIRKYVEKIAGKERILNVYLPTIIGKEKRKTVPSAAGLLGVEGTDDKIIIEALARAGVVGEPLVREGRKIEKSDLYNLGLSGVDGSKERRASFCRHLRLPENLPSNSLIDVLNSLFGFDDFMCEVEKWKQEEAES